MAKRKPRTRQAEIVGLFAARLREVRRASGMTQAELAHRAGLTAAYVWRLESGGAAAGIDTVARLATALGTTPADLLPAAAPPDPLAVLQEQARRLFEAVLASADRETLLLLNPFLARLTDGPSHAR